MNQMAEAMEQLSRAVFKNLLDETEAAMDCRRPSYDAEEEPYVDADE